MNEKNPNHSIHLTAVNFITSLEGRSESSNFQRSQSVVVFLTFHFAHGGCLPLTFSTYSHSGQPM